MTANYDSMERVEHALVRQWRDTPEFRARGKIAIPLWEVLPLEIRGLFAAPLVFSFDDAVEFCTRIIDVQAMTDVRLRELVAHRLLARFAGKKMCETM